MSWVVHIRKVGETIGELSKLLYTSADAVTPVNIIVFDLQSPISPEDLPRLILTVKEKIAELDTTKPVAVSGRGPVWLYAAIVHELHYFPAVLVHDPRIGFVVVETHTRTFRVGDVVKIQ